MLEEGNEFELVEVGEAEDGERVHLEMGQELMVKLPSNPSTGYRWEVIEADETILEQVGEAEYHPPGSLAEIKPGAGGVESLRFRATGPGLTVLILAYRRPWEIGEPRESYTLQVSVGQDTDSEG